MTLKTFKCDNCGKVIQREKKRAKRIFCGKACAMKGLWKLRKGIDPTSEIREAILSSLAKSKGSMDTAQHIGLRLDKNTYEITANLKAMDGDRVYKIYPESGSCIWGLMKNFRCYECGTTKNPSDVERNTCQSCETFEKDFQIKWSTTPITSLNNDMPVWIYGASR